MEKHHSRIYEVIFRKTMFGKTYNGKALTKQTKWFQKYTKQ